MVYYKKMSSKNEEFQISKFHLLNSLKFSERSHYLPLNIINNEYLLTHIESKIVLLDINSLSEICP